MTVQTALKTRQIRLRVAAGKPYHARCARFGRDLVMSVKENIERMRELSRQAELGGGEDRQRRQRESGRLTARERVEFLLDRGSFVELDKFKTHRCDRLRNGRRRDPGRRRGHRLRHDRRAAGLRLLAGLHGFRRQPLGRVRGEGLQGDGPRDEDRMPGDRIERFGRRANPGRRGVARRLCRHLSAQRDGLGRGAADFRASWGRAPAVQCTRLR